MSSGVTPRPASVVVEGQNYRIVVDRGVAICTVWKRPDLSRDEGAQLAAEKVAHHVALAQGSRLVARALIFDLREAPSSWGPETNASLRAILAAWLAVRRRVAVIAADDSVQRLLVRDLLRDLRDRTLNVVESMEAAQAWVGD